MATDEIKIRNHNIIDKRPDSELIEQPVTTDGRKDNRRYEKQIGIAGIIIDENRALLEKPAQY